MLNHQYAKVCSFIGLIYLLSGCASLFKSQEPPQLYSQEVTARNSQMKSLTDWQIFGKIAFFQGTDRNSATLNWQYLQSKQSQRLDLTTYLGINVLHLTSKNNIHTVKVNGTSYQDENLDELIYALTGYALPTEALTYWLKGLAYQENDVIAYHRESKLPIRLTSEYNSKQWLINYDRFQNTNNFQLPSKITIKQGNLTIKIVINRWKV